MVVSRLEAQNQTESLWDLVRFLRESFISYSLTSTSRSWRYPGTDPFLPQTWKLIPCIRFAMLSPDCPTAGVPHILGEVVVLPNKFGLLDTAEGKMQEHIVYKVENALSKNMSLGRATILLVPAKS